MQTIEKKIEDCNRWRKAQETVEGFYKMMELIKKYPPRQLKEVKSLPWEVSY